MPVRTPEELKSFFQTGDTPTESNFIDLIDSSTVTVLTPRTLTILAMGQSNMCGHYGGGGDYTTNANVTVWNGTAWVTADLMQNPFLAQDLYGTAPNNNSAFHFCKKLQEETGLSIRLLTSFHTGRPISWWVPSSGTGYADALTKIAASGTTKIDIVLWDQGEGNTGSAVVDYAADFNLLVSQLRGEASISNTVPILCAQMKDGTAYDNMNAFYNNIHRYVTDEYVNVAQTSELAIDGGANDPLAVHFSGTSQVTIGRDRFWQAYQSTPANVNSLTGLARTDYANTFLNNGINTFDGQTVFNDTINVKSTELIQLNAGVANTTNIGCVGGEFQLNTPTLFSFLTGQVSFSNHINLPSSKLLQFNAGVANDYNLGKVGTVFSFNSGGKYAFNGGAIDTITSSNSDWAVGIVNNGTTLAHGLFVNIGVSSTGLPFRASINNVSKLEVNNSGNTIAGGVVCIGIDPPEASLKLDCSGTAALGVQTSARIYLGTIDATNGFIQCRDTSVNRALTFAAASYNFTTGNVGINIVSANANAILDVTSTTKAVMLPRMTTAQKAAIAALTPGAAQGSISAGAQTLAAAMPTTLVNSIPATILYNASNSKVVAGAGLGDYIKVPSIASVTSATIAAEYAKMYAIAPSKVVNNTTNVPFIYAPLGDLQLIKIANNAVGAAQQVNFLVVSYL